MSQPIARVTFLGTGTSHGVPMIGCRCATCRSDDPRDRRWRASIFIEIAGGASLLVDTAIDLRAQALQFGVGRVDAVLFTHSHADHIFGLDDVRRFNELQRGAIACYGDEATIAEVARTFRYAFHGDSGGSTVPQLRLFPLAGPFSVGGVTIVPVPILHGRQRILGYRLGDFAYLTDCSGIPETSWRLLGGLGTLVIGALRDRPHPTHFTLAQALAAVERAAPRRALLTHLCHDLGHEATSERLPRGVEVAYDGLTAEIAGD